MLGKYLNKRRVKNGEMLGFLQQDERLEWNFVENEVFYVKSKSNIKHNTVRLLATFFNSTNCG